MTTSYNGTPAAPGISLGLIYVYQSHAGEGELLPVPEDDGHSLQPAEEWQHFLHAQQAVEKELQDVSESLNTVAVDIFDVHQLILHDRTLTSAIHDAIYLSDTSAVRATYQAVLDMAELFRSLDDEYFASRAGDILDIGKRLLQHLGIQVEESPLQDLHADTILVAQDLTPSDVARLPVSKVTGIALAESTPTAHSSILARSLGLPLVCGLGRDVLDLRHDAPAILDGTRGRLLVDAVEEERAHYQTILVGQQQQRAAAFAHAQEDAVTKDGMRVPVYANANHPEDAEQVPIVGADGIGLLRTEYLFQGRATPPSVEEQRVVYSAIAAQLQGRMFTLRALDAGGDKPVEFLLGPLEDNPFLGKRGMRLLLSHPDLLRDQYVAFVLAVRPHLPTIQARFMLPMISTYGEAAQARALIDTAHREMFGEERWQTGIKLGILIEVPSAALIARHLADLVDFFSIGTNDLAQYVLASDRTNSAVAHFADPFHPAVLTLIRLVCRAAMEVEKPVSLCGEMAGNVDAIPLLLGLGITELSAPLPTVPPIKQVIREWNMADCRDLAELALRCQSIDRVRTLLSTSRND